MVLVAGEDFRRLDCRVEGVLLAAGDRARLIGVELEDLGGRPRGIVKGTVR